MSDNFDFGSDFGAILGRFWEDFSKRRGGYFFICFSFVFSCAGALEVVFFALAATRAPKRFDRENTCFSCFFEVRLAVGGAARKAREAQKENQNSTQKTTETKRKNSFFKAQDQASKKAPPKTRKT